MEIWRKMGVSRKVISLDQSYLIENDSLLLLNVPAYNARKMTILTSTLPFLLKRQLCVLLVIKYSKILFLQADNIPLVNWFWESANHWEHFNDYCHSITVIWRGNKSSAMVASIVLWTVWTWSHGLHQVLVGLGYKYLMGSVHLPKTKCGPGLFCISQKVSGCSWRLHPRRTYLWIGPEAEAAFIEMMTFAREASRRVISSHESSLEALEQERFK